MGVTRNQLYRRFTVVFLISGLVAISCLCAGIALPFWYEADWALHSPNDKDGPRYLVYQGLWSDYVCKQLDNYDDCVVNWHQDYRGDYREDMLHVMPKLNLLRGVELASLAFGVLSGIGLIFLPLSLTRGGWRQYLAQAVFAGFSLLAGFLAVLGVLVLTAKSAPSSLHWALVLPTVAGFLWLFNGSMSFVVCRYDPTYGTPDNPVVPIVESE
ncbi:hypothetical protein BaRGS_00009532 [Batillaria attramentaria]|uniref:Uncharacterized protein n=1 Tax=Batillaria attramentaria TaxID=370345 RepID=A0ABD0LJW0_9CAEN